MEDQLAAVGTPQDAFVLMLHDRLVDLESALRELKPPEPDPRVRLLGAQRRAHSGAVFVRVVTRRPVGLGEWADGVLRVAGRIAPVRFDLWACQHYGLADNFVTECMVQRSDVAPLCAAAVGHAALDSADGLGTTALRADVAAVTCTHWVAESIRGAAAAGGGARMYTWDPMAGVTVSQDVTDLDESGCGTPQELAAWAMLHGWLAAHTEPTELWHPRATSAFKMATDLVATLAKLA